MSTDPSSSPILPATLSEAQSLLADLDVLWAEHPEVQNTPPLWQGALAHVDPHWASVMGRATNWIDSVPVILMQASVNIAPGGVVKEYAKIASDLEELLKHVSKGPGNVSVIGEEGSPSQRLEAILKEKKVLDEASRRRITLMQDALDLGADSRLLAAMISDAIPLLSAKIVSERELIERTGVGSMLEAQRAARNLKFLDRAESALSLVQTRIQNEASAPNSVNRSGLERMIQEEEQLHGRLEGMAGNIARAIAGEHIQTQTTAQGAALAAIVPSQSSDINLPVMAVQVVEEKRGFLARLFGKKDAEHGLQKEISPSVEKIVPNAPKLPVRVESILKTAEERYEGYPILQWREYESVFDEPLLRASSRMPISGMSFLDKLIEEQSWNFKYRNKNALEHIEMLLEREEFPIAENLCDWKQLLKVCMAQIKASSEEREVKQCWAAFRVIGKTGHFMNPAPHGLELAKMAAYFSSSVSPSSKEHQAALKILEEFLPMDVVAEAIKKMEDGLSAKGFFSLINEFKNPILASKATLSYITSSSRYRGEEQDGELIGRLSPDDRNLLIRHFMENDGSRSQVGKARLLLGTSPVQADLAVAPSPETQWSFGLKEWVELKSSHHAQSNELVPSCLLACALSSENMRLAKSVLASSKSNTLDGKIQEDEHSRHMISKVIDLSAKQTGETNIQVNTWCALFEKSLESKSPVNFSPAKGVESHEDLGFYSIEAGVSMKIKQSAPSSVLMTPLMQAAYMGNDEWVSALLKSGVDPHQVVEGRSAIHMLKTHVAKEVMRYAEGGQNITETHSKLENAFARQMAHKMNETGLWDIEGASPKGLLPKVISAVMTADVVAESQNIERKKAIIQTICKSGTDVFMDALSASIKPQGAFEINSQEVFTLLKFGANAGVIEDSLNAFENILKKDVHQRGQMEGAVEARRRGRRHERGRLGARV